MFELRYETYKCGHTLPTNGKAMFLPLCYFGKISYVIINFGYPLFFAVQLFLCFINIFQLIK